MKTILPQKVTLMQPKWQTALTQLITDPEVLFDRLKLDKIYLSRARAACRLFPLRVSEHYVNQIQPSNWHDPLLRQILPIEEETQSVLGFEKDPLQEKNFNPIPGLLHKYRSRVLLTVTQACAIHCRYCFRRDFDYHQNRPGKSGWATIVKYIQRHPEINEVIYSGGDPLMVDDKYLAELTQNLAKIPQLCRLRLHTRLPILIPERINTSLIEWLTAFPNLKPIMVLHCNHPRELSPVVCLQLQKLTQAGIILLNQSVLLKDVNDNVEILVKLSESLFAAGVLPYYLHLLDRLQGTAHFEVTKKRGVELIQQMTACLPGYLVPKLAQEEVGQPAKTVFAS